MLLNGFPGTAGCRAEVAGTAAFWYVARAGFAMYFGERFALVAS